MNKKPKTGTAQNVTKDTRVRMQGVRGAMQQNTQKRKKSNEKDRGIVSYSTTLRSTRAEFDYERYDDMGKNTEEKYSQRKRNQREQAMMSKKQTSEGEARKDTWRKQLKIKKENNTLDT